MTGTTAVKVTLDIPYDLEKTSEGRFIVRNDDLRIAVSGETEAKALLSFQEGVRELADFEQKRRGSLRLDPLEDLLQPV